jgi:hypothetical protein
MAWVLTSAGLDLTAAGWVAGACGRRVARSVTWVGYISENRGYEVNATPASPLRNVLATAGPFVPRWPAQAARADHDSARS